MSFDLPKYKNDFIKYIVDNDILRFGEFTLKSGRVSPYFFNSGLFNTGFKLSFLGKAYANALDATDYIPDLIYGPAYKGIPLACITAIEIAKLSHIDLPYAFNRKEEKDHGEGGSIIGCPLSDSVWIIDDVITSGISVKESIDIIKANGATPGGVLIAFDRQEKGIDTNYSAVQMVEQDFGIPVVSIIGLNDVIKYLIKTDSAYMDNVLEYVEKYGV
jgi:orotate phosphoribosyltransferase